MKYADLRKYDVSNWSGINSTLFVTGCHFHCEGCWNLEAQDFNYGKEYTKEVEDLFMSYVNDKHVDGKWTCPQCGNNDINKMSICRRVCGLTK